MISAFFGRFKKLNPPGETIEKDLKSIISALLSVSEDSFNIRFKKPNIVISSNTSSLKNEIYMNKERIVRELNKKMGKKCFEQIYFK